MATQQVKKTKEEIRAEQYVNFKKFLSTKRFQRRLEYLSKKYKDKKVVFYGNGLYFDVLVELYDLNKYFNVVGVADYKYLREKVEQYKGYSVYGPFELQEIDFDVVLCSAVNPAPILDYIEKFDILPEGVDFETIAFQLKRNIVKRKTKKTFALLKWIFNSFNFKKAIKYAKVLTTTEINSKTNYLRVIKKLKKRNTKKEPIKVLFIVEENEKWGYQSVYDELIKDENFKVLPIVCVPILTQSRIDFTQQKSIQFFKKLNIEAIDGYDKEKEEYLNFESMKPDIIFYQHPWYVKKIFHPKNVSKYALTCIVSYGYSSIDVKTWGSVAGQKVISNMWKMFCESLYHEKFYKEAAKIRDDEILLTTGYPKMDYYKEPISPEIEALWKDKESKRPRIIWAPHHTIEDNGTLGMSNFKTCYKFFLDFAKNNPQYSFIFKPHPMLGFKCQSANFMTNEEYNSYLDEWNNLKNASVYDKGNYFDIFKTSDVLITDCSSFLGEYYFSQKPIIFLDKDTRCGFNEFGLKIKETFYIPNKVEQVPELLNELLINKNDYKKEDRLKLIKSEYYYPKHGVGKEIVDYIRSVVL